MEASLSDLAKARRVYSQCIKQTLAHGTTTAAYYATRSADSTNLLSDICLQHGQRGFIGRCCMDQLSPDYYRDESVEAAIADTRNTIEHVRNIDPENKLITPIITPRFAPSCSSELMHALSALQKETNLPVQTHVSENTNEISLVKSMFPKHSSYTAVYDDHGLLTPKTILAHAVHISEEEASLIVNRKSKVSHCPVSNSALTSGAANVRWMLNKGIEVGLGSDVSGGYSPSILMAARHAMLISRHIAMDGAEESKLSVEEVLYLSTRGGARVVGLEDRTGGFDVGMDWDAQLIDLGPNIDVDAPANQYGPVNIFGWESWEEKVAKWLFSGDDRNTTSVWVRGQSVHQRSK